jgi:integrase
MTATSKREITLDVVSSLEPGSLVWDTKVTGFGVRCQTKAKSYVLKYRINGRQRWYVIGRHGAPWTPKTARDRAKALQGEIAAGNDPAAKKEEVRATPTFGEVAMRFMSEHAVNLAESSAKEYQRLLNKLILPALGKIKITDVARQDISKLHHSLRETPYAANRVLAVLGKLFNLAEAWGYRPDHSNPCLHVKKYHEEARERMLSAQEIGRLGEALRGFNGSPYAVAAIKLLVFTGARLSEVLRLQWEQIDFDRGEVRLANHKTRRTRGAKTIHLPPPALEVLARLPRIEGNPHVIVGDVKGAHLVNLQKPWRSIRRAANLEDVRLHDLRHAFASVAASSGMSLPIIGKMLGHSQPQTTNRYAHLADDPVKAAATVVAASIESAMKSENIGSVVTMRKTIN